MTRAAFPCRLHVLMARDAPLAVVLRRGPARSVCTLAWDRRTDELRVGQWFRGRIYERRSDVSPDGRHLIYFAARQGGAAPTAETPTAWTAVSRAPFLTALVLLAKTDRWNGGGLFTSDRRYWLNGCGHSVVRDSPEVEIDATWKPRGGVGGEDLSVYYPRLLRDGWALASGSEVDRLQHRVVFEKPASCGWTLRKYAHAGVHQMQGRSFYWDEHEIEHRAGGAVLSFPDWEWADLDGERVVWAAAGRLCAARFTAGGLCEETEIADLNGMRFERRLALYSVS